MVILVNSQNTLTLIDIRRIATVHRFQLESRTWERGLDHAVHVQLSQRLSLHSVPALRL